MKRKLISILALSCIIGMGVVTLASCNGSNDVVVDKTITIYGTDKVEIGSSTTFVAKNGDTVLDSVKWTSSNKSVAIIDSATGEVTAIAVGTTTITASSEGFDTASFLLTVYDPSLKTLVISGETRVAVGDSIALSVADESGTIDSSTVTWGTSDANIATVSNRGIVDGQAEGTVIITAIKEGYNSAQYTITVTPGTTAQDTYNIIYPSLVGVKFVNAVTKAKSGDTVTFSIEVTTEGVSIEDVRENGTVITPSTEGVYSFTMPDEDVEIKVTLSVESDVSVSGEMAIPLVKDTDDGIYKALNVDVPKTVQLMYLVKQEDGTLKQLTYQDFNHEACFGFIAFPSDYNTYSFELGGGCTYNFYYDPSAEEPAYIVRTKVNSLPSSATSFAQLFDNGRSELTTFPKNVSKVEYTNSEKSESYTWNRYADNSSLGVTTDLKDPNKTLGLTYKKYDGNHFTIVNSYTGDDNYKEITNIGYYNAYSGIYDVIPTKAERDTYDRKYYSITKQNALFEANRNGHDMYSLEFDIMYGYRVGFDTTALTTYTLKSSSVSVKSTANASGGFSTNITSRKTYDDATENYKMHFEYTIAMEFNGDGSVKSGTYSEKSYGTDDYDFDKDEFKTGGKDRGTDVKELTFSYEYSTDVTATSNFDTTPYFISNLNSVRINNDDINTDTSKNVLKKNDYISTDDGTLTFDYAPSTALDSRQYDIIESSDEKIIGHSNVYRQFKALNPGTATVTIGNHTTNAVTKNVDVTVDNSVSPWSVYIDGTDSRSDLEDRPDDNSASIYADKISTLVVKSSPSASDNSQLVFTVESGKENLLKLSYDPTENLLTYDTTGAKDITVDTKVKVTVTAPNWDPEVSDQYETLTFTILPNVALDQNIFVGTWQAVADQGDGVNTDNDTVQFTTTAVSKNGTTYMKGYASDSSDTVEFLWAIIDNKLAVATTAENSNDEVYITYDNTTGQIGFYYAIFVQGDTYEDSYYQTFLGFDTGDDDDPDQAYEMFYKLA